MNLSNYGFETLRRDGQFIVFRGRPRGQPAAGPPSILATAPEMDPPSLENLRRMEHEYSLRTELDPEWAIRPLALASHEGRQMLVLSDPGGEPLDRLLGKPMELTRFLRLAIDLSAALRQMHGRGFVHKDLKPANILVNRENGEIHLTGFGIATRLPRERQAPSPPEAIEGTLAYMAPEQTGRMNRSIDSRSDLYSLGVTLYQALTGALPFIAADPMEWVHCHIARPPIPPSERSEGIPTQVSHILVKLLAKTAEERYQTAAGVERDLRRCLAEWKLQGRIAPFALGEHDTPDRLMIPERLYGRAREVDTLLASFDRIVKGGRPEFVLVSGYPGIGKSAVINELHKPLVPPRGLFASGKFDQYKRDIPYSTLAQAFQSLTRRLLMTSEAELARWRDSLREALAPNGRLMTELVPELALIIGEQPPVPELPPQQAQSRFQLVFRRFIGVFARAEHPLALALDDLQWLDAATLDLVEDLLTRADLRHLLLIGAYRDNEVSAAHPLVRKLKAIQEAGTQVHQICLAPLTRDDLTRLISDALHCEPARAAPLADLLHEKTAGNPFFAIQFLVELVEQGLVTFAHDQARWLWDPARIHTKGYTANVVDLMVGKLSRLPAETTMALQQLACFGNRAETSALALALGTSETQVNADLSEAVRSGLIEQFDGCYKFVHDRVHEAAYGMVAASERAPAHLRIGRLLLAETASDALEGAVFDIVNHFNRSVDLISAQEERERVAALNVRAGKRAKRSTAYAAARNYLAQAAALGSSDSWMRRYQATFELYLLLSECEYLAGHFDAANDLFDTILGKASSDLDKARVHSLRIKLYALAGRYDQALSVGLEALRSFGVFIPEADQDIEAAVEAQFADLPVRLGGHAIGDLLTAPVADDPVTRATIDLLVESMPCAYTAKPPLFPLVTLEAVNRSIRDGNTDQSSFAYGAFAIWLVAGPRDISSAFQFSQLSLHLNERFDNRRLRGPLLHLHADHVNFWQRHFSTGLPIMEEAFRACLEVGDLMHAGMQANETLWHLIENGTALEAVMSASTDSAAFARQSHNDAIHKTILVQQCFIRILMGRTPAPLAFDETFVEETSTHAAGLASFGIGVAFHHIMQMMLAVLGGRYAAAMEAAEKAEEVLGAVMAMPIEATFHFFHALALAAQYPAVPRDQQEEYFRLLDEKRKKLGFWAEHCPENFQNRAALIGAEIARIGGREIEAERLYEQAIRSARSSGFVHSEAIAYEVAARFYAARGFEKFADAYFLESRHCYQRWGADGKVRQLEQWHLRRREREPVPSPTSTIGTSIERLDLATVVKVSQTVTGEIVLEKLIDTLMRTAIEYAGAERGLLILLLGGKLRVAAEVTISNDTVIVGQREASTTMAALPESIVYYVMRTQESVILDDASAENPFSADTYVRQHHSRSILCMPLISNTKQVGALYLENSLTSHAFTPARTAVLKLLASQAAISLENARLYKDAQQMEAYLKAAQTLSRTGSFGWRPTTGEIVWSEETYHIMGCELGSKPTLELVLQRTHPEDAELVREAIERGSEEGRDLNFEHRLLLPDGSVKSVHIVGHPTSDEAGDIEYVGAIMDITARKRAEESLRESQAELAHITRVMTMGELVASIAHEVSQPLASVVINAGACLRWLDAERIEDARRSAAQTVAEGSRASEVIGRIRALARKTPPQKEWLDVNEAIHEVITLVRNEIRRNGLSLEMQLAEHVPVVQADRIQLQQVVLNLVMNAIEALSGVRRSSRELLIRSEIDESNHVLVSVQDTGPGFDPKRLEHLFDAFYTTKPQGLGMGLSISRSIVDAHGGRLWATVNSPKGAVFQFTLPIAADRVA